MRALLASLALAAAATSGTATAQSASQPFVAAVSYADLNLANPAGRAALEGRVKAAANRVCVDLTITPVEEVTEVANCRASLLGSAQRQLGLVALRSPGGMMLASR